MLIAIYLFNMGLHTRAAVAHLP